MKRVIGLDVFRGIVILSMIFVNYVAGMKGIPTFLEHEKAGIDNFTFADLIFPAFLLMVGVSIPLGLGKRIERNEPLKKSSSYLQRTTALLVMGVGWLNPGPSILWPPECPPILVSALLHRRSSF